MTDIIEKIRKLLALSKSANASEAATAAALAQKLMAKYRLQPHDVNDPVELLRRDPEPLLVWTGVRKPPVWLGVLARGVCESNGCTVVLERSARDKWTAWVFGLESDCATARYLTAWLRSEVERLTIKNYRAHMAPVEFQYACDKHGARSFVRCLKDSYRIGCIEAAIEAMKRANVEAAAGDSTALAVVDGRLADAKQLMRAMCGGAIQEDDRGMRVNRAGVEAGKRAGQHLHGSKPIGAGGTRMLGDGK